MHGKIRGIDIQINEEKYFRRNTYIELFER